MHNIYPIPVTENDYFLLNTAYLFKLRRVSQRITVTDASARSGLSEKTINDLEWCKLKEVSSITLTQLAKIYGLQQLKFIYTTAPTNAEWAELTAKGKELGNKIRCKHIPKPGTCRQAKMLDEEWLQWGNLRLQKFNERVAG